MVAVRSRVSAVVSETAYISFIITNRNNISNFSTRWEFKSLSSDTFLSLNITNLTDEGLKLILPLVQLGDRGTYRITVTSPTGSDTATVDLDVFGKSMHVITFVLHSIINNSCSSFIVY